MVIQCPQCDSKYRLDEKQFAGREEVMVRCRQCGAGFSVQAREALSYQAPAAVPDSTHVDRKGRVPELPADMAVALAVTRGPLKGLVFPVTKPRVVLGRAGADIVLADSEVSRQHCALEIHGRQATLFDLGSTNGTFVNGKPVQSCPLEHFSEFRIGSNLLMFTVTPKGEH